MSHAILPDIPLQSIEDLEELYTAVEALRDKLEYKLKAVESIDSTTSTADQVAAIIAALTK